MNPYFGSWIPISTMVFMFASGRARLASASPPPAPGKAARPGTCRLGFRVDRVLGAGMGRTHGKERSVPGWCRRVVCLLLVALTLSCTTSARYTRLDGTPALTTGHWTKVRSDPPTYFPKGVPADHPTTHHDGSWVSTGDAQGTRFFIPFRGKLPAEYSELVSEALAERDPSKAEALAEEDRREQQAAAAGIALAPLALPLMPIVHPIMAAEKHAEQEDD